LSLGLSTKPSGPPPPTSVMIEVGHLEY